MGARKLSRRSISTLLWAGLVGVVVAAALTPSSDAVTAQANCQYGNCTFFQSTTFLYLLIGAVLLAVFLGAAALAVALGRRRRGNGGYESPFASAPPPSFMLPESAAPPTPEGPTPAPAPEPPPSEPAVEPARETTSPGQPPQT